MIPTPHRWHRAFAALVTAGLLALAPSAVAAHETGAAKSPSKASASKTPRSGYCTVQRGSTHCQRRAGFEVHASWDRESWAHPEEGAGAYGSARPGWPLSNVIVDVEP